MKERTKELIFDAGFPSFGAMYVVSHGEELERFEKLVRDDERQAIWNILFDYAGRDDLSDDDESLLAHLAKLIKERGEK